MRVDIFFAWSWVTWDSLISIYNKWESFLFCMPSESFRSSFLFPLAWFLYFFLSIKNRKLRTLLLVLIFTWCIWVIFNILNSKLLIEISIFLVSHWHNLSRYRLKEFNAWLNTWMHPFCVFTNLIICLVVYILKILFNTTWLWRHIASQTTSHNTATIWYTLDLLSQDCWYICRATS